MGKPLKLKIAAARGTPGERPGAARGLTGAGRWRCKGARDAIRRGGVWASGGIAVDVEVTELSGELFVAAHDHWLKIRGDGRDLPLERDLDPVEFPTTVWPYCELVEVLTDPLDFRYRLIGTAIYDISRKNYTGLSVREIPTQAPPSRMFSYYDLGYERKAPLCARLPYTGPDGFITSIRNLLLPFGDGTGEVTLFWSIVEISRKVGGKPV